MPNSDLSVLLDLDGTLIDSQPGIVSSCRAALRALGHEPPEVMDIVDRTSYRGGDALSAQTLRRRSHL